MRTIFVILGPTSTGKTSLALELCSQINAEIISADSRQICKYMDIGTGKLPINSDISVSKGLDHWVLNGTKIWGYDLIYPDEYFSSYDFGKFAIGKIDEIHRGGKSVVIVGGTGFYINVLTKRVPVSSIKPNFELRSLLELLAINELQQRLAKLNPKTFDKIDKFNKARLIRAIELELSENSLLEPLPGLEDISFEYIGLKSANKFLYDRVDMWMDNIWHVGLIQEVEKLMDLGFKNTPRLSSLIYKTVVAFISGEIGESDAIQRAKYDIHAYVRRQLTWFNKDKQIKWFDVSNSAYKSDMFKYVEELRKMHYNSYNG